MFTFKIKNLSNRLLVIFSFATLASSAWADVNCRAVLNQTPLKVPMVSEDADHVYYSAHSGTDFFDATYHKTERFAYLQIITGPRSAPTQVSGTYVMNGGGLPATLNYTLGTKFLQFSCQN